MAEKEEKELNDVLQKALWQVEEAKKLALSTSKPMDFINLSKEAQGYGNRRLAIGLLNKARENLFNDMVDHVISTMDDGVDVVAKMRLERTINEARKKFKRGDTEDSYQMLIETLNSREECSTEEEEVCPDDQRAEKYSEALDSLQKVWLKMKTEEQKGKDMARAKKLIREAKSSLSKKMYDRVLDLCREVMDSIQSPQDKLREEVQETIDDISRTLRGLFPEQPRSPKEKFFKKQIEDLISRSRKRLSEEKPVEAINSSRKAREILKRLEQESIKGDIPKMIIELRGSLDELKANDVDTSYEEYLLKQVEETFWDGEYIKARKIANKLNSIVLNAKDHMRVNMLSTKLTSLDNRLKSRAGQEGYLQAREFIDKAKMLMDQSAYDLASNFLDKANNFLEN